MAKFIKLIRIQGPILRTSLVFVMAFALSALAVAGEGFEHGKWRYLVKYQGVFSAGSEISIADLSWETMPVELDSQVDYLQSRLFISSEKHAFVENLYPFRYQIDSWFMPESAACLAFKGYKQTKKTKHYLAVIDEEKDALERIDLTENNNVSVLESLEFGDYVREQGIDSYDFPISAGTFDRISMLQRLRSENLKVGDDLTAWVRTKDKKLRYRIRVEKEDVIELAGSHWPSWKLRLDAVKFNEEGRERPSHRSVFLWLSRDSSKVFLKALVRHTIGDFSVQLVDAGHSGPKEVLASK